MFFLWFMNFFNFFYYYFLPVCILHWPFCRIIVNKEYSAFSILRIFHTPLFPYYSFSILRTPQSSFSIQPEETVSYPCYHGASIILVYSPLGDYRHTHKPHKCFVEKFVFWHTGEYRWHHQSANTRPTNNIDVRCPVRKTLQERSQLKEGWETEDNLRFPADIWSALKIGQ